MDAAFVADERTTLLEFLQRQRDLVAWKLGDVADGAIRGIRTPSGLTAHGLVLHLTNTERSWIRDVFAGQAGLRFDWSEADRDGDWRPDPALPMRQLLADYAAECARCDEVIAAASLDDVGRTRPATLRWIVVHLIEETARHVGHADLLREQADGSVGEDPF
jgi:uncharacterized protein DUF664